MYVTAGATFFTIMISRIYPAHMNTSNGYTKGISKDNNDSRIKTADMPANHQKYLKILVSAPNGQRYLHQKNLKISDPTKSTVIVIIEYNTTTSDPNPVATA